jgi:hypothetical protein
MRIEGDRETLMAEGDTAWAELCTVLDAAKPGVPIHDPDSPEWTSRDVYTHFIRMHAGSARAIRHELETDQRYQWSGLDENELNERNVADDRAIELDEARRQAIEARADYRALVAGLTAEQFEAIGRRHGDDLLGGHYRGHLDYIEAARKE